eukprot:TRINITY_DN8657_c0_g1_i1.p1 TRINITY_DN8657_c0_g1~~TRINITY_DN8657_c0_g1_i1.p1  ORF type:complete len:631 (-),score=51.95 TRINITY_DN8657_c0_g1_i1:169-2061(-)
MTFNTYLLEAMALADPATVAREDSVTVGGAVIAVAGHPERALGAGRGVGREAADPCARRAGGKGGGQWECHNYLTSQDDSWCMTNPVLGQYQHVFVGGASEQCGGCHCCKRQIYSPLKLSVGVGAWQCHHFVSGQDDAWCYSNPVGDGVEYRPSGGDLACDSCSCCKRRHDVPNSNQGTLDTLVVYELFVRKFSESGTFAAVETWASQLRQLGVTCVWFMPIHPLGEAPHGSPYSVQDYQAANTDYGSLDNFRSLALALRSQGIRCIIDWVAGHTAWNHAWIQQHPDFYSRNSSGHIVAASDSDGNIWADVADLNYTSSATLHDNMLEAMRYWVTEVGVDGFRCDHAEAVPRSFWSRAISDLRSRKQDLIMLAEGAQQWLLEAGFNLTYGWNSYHTVKAVFRDTSPVFDIALAYDRESVSLGSAGRRLQFITNHDFYVSDGPPPILFGGHAAATCAQAVAAFLPGAPLIYNGQEVGTVQNISLWGTGSLILDSEQSPGVRAWYQKLLNSRSTHFALTNGAINFYNVSSDVFVASRAVAEHSAVLVANVRNRQLSVQLPESVISSQLQDIFTGDFISSQLTLQPHAALLFVSTPVSTTVGGGQADSGIGVDFRAVGILVVLPAALILHLFS